MALFPIFCSFVCVHSQSGQADLFVFKCLSDDKEEGTMLFPTYSCPNCSGAKYGQWIYTQDEVREPSLSVKYSEGVFAWPACYVKSKRWSVKTFCTIGHLWDSPLVYNKVTRKVLVIRNIDLFHDLSLNRLFQKQSTFRWFETQLCPFDVTSVSTNCLNVRNNVFLPTPKQYLL